MTCSANSLEVIVEELSFHHSLHWFRVMKMFLGALLKEWMGKDALHLQLLILSTFRFSFSVEGSFLLILPLSFSLKYNKKIQDTKNTNKTIWHPELLNASKCHPYTVLVLILALKECYTADMMEFCKLEKQCEQNQFCYLQIRMIMGPSRPCSKKREGKIQRQWRARNPEWDFCVIGLCAFWVTACISYLYYFEYPTLVTAMGGTWKEMDIWSKQPVCPVLHCAVQTYALCQNNLYNHCHILKPCRLAITATM